MGPDRRKGPGRWLVVVLLALVVLMGGCIGEPDSGPSEEGEATQPNQAADGPAAQVDPVVLEATYGGHVVYRAPNLVLPDAQWEGDPPGFCFETPADTTDLSATLTWSPPQSLVLEFSGPNGTGERSWDPNQPWTALLNVTPPIEMSFSEPEPGTWYVYAGPPAVGGQYDWNLTLTWTVERQGATVNETVYDGEPCGV